MEYLHVNKEDLCMLISINGVKFEMGSRYLTELENLMRS